MNSSSFIRNNNFAHEHQLTRTLNSLYWPNDDNVALDAIEQEVAIKTEPVDVALEFQTEFGAEIVKMEEMNIVDEFYIKEECEDFEEGKSIVSVDILNSVKNELENNSSVYCDEVGNWLSNNFSALNVIEQEVTVTTEPIDDLEEGKTNCDANILTSIKEEFEDQASWFNNNILAFGIIKQEVTIRTDLIEHFSEEFPNFQCSNKRDFELRILENEELFIKDEDFVQEEKIVDCKLKEKPSLNVHLEEHKYCATHTDEKPSSFRELHQNGEKPSKFSELQYSKTKPIKFNKLELSGKKPSKLNNLQHADKKPSKFKELRHTVQKPSARDKPSKCNESQHTEKKLFKCNDLEQIANKLSKFNELQHTEENPAICEEFDRTENFNEEFLHIQSPIKTALELRYLENDELIIKDENFAQKDCDFIEEIIDSNLMEKLSLNVCMEDHKYCAPLTAKRTFKYHQFEQNSDKLFKFRELEHGEKSSNFEKLQYSGDISSKLNESQHTAEKPFQFNEIQRSGEKPSQINELQRTNMKTSKFNESKHTVEKPSKCNSEAAKETQNGHTSATKTLKNCVYKTEIYYMCSRCNYKSPKKYIVSRHLKIHKKKRVLWKCAKCHYNSLNRRLLQQHLTTHTKAFKCTKCNYRASRQLYLDVHMKTHTNSSYKCSECEYTALQRSTVTRHFNSFHLDV